MIYKIFNESGAGEAQTSTDALLRVDGGLYKICVLNFSGDYAENSQVVQSLNNDAFYTYFGKKLQAYTVSCMDGKNFTCEGKKSTYMSLGDVLNYVDSKKGTALTMSITMDKVTFTGVIMNVKINITKPLSGYYITFMGYKT